jgi:hypothetical protein
MRKASLKVSGLSKRGEDGNGDWLDSVAALALQTAKK